MEDYTREKAGRKLMRVLESRLRNKLNSRELLFS